MPKQHDPKELGRILRRRGSRQHADVQPNVTEIRSCGVIGQPEPVPPGDGNLLGGLIIIWEFCLEDVTLVPRFHKLLRDIEVPLSEGLPNIEPKGAGRYLGTYMLNTGGVPCYRTLWAYRSLEDMTAIWAKATQAKSNVLDQASQLRAFWLSDPDRHEARYTPARNLYQDGKNLGDAFAWITVKVAQMGIPRDQP